MRGAEVHIVVEDGSLSTGMLLKSPHLIAYDRIHGIVRSEHYHIIGLNVGIGELKMIMGMVLIEDILRIVPVIEEG